MALPSSKTAFKYKCPGGTFPTLGFALAVHLQAVRGTGGPEEVRDEGLVVSALTAPLKRAFGEDAYSTLFDKVSAIGFKIGSNQHFVEGNKRTALLLTEAALEFNGYELNFLNQHAKIMLFSLVGAGYLDREGLKHASLLGCGMDPLVYNQQWVSSLETLC